MFVSRGLSILVGLHRDYRFQCLFRILGLGYITWTVLSFNVCFKQINELLSELRELFQCLFPEEKKEKKKKVIDLHFQCLFQLIKFLCGC
ncbi:MAG: hypothetical protein DRJ40_09565 [Thermoprotei archaeon]|nr:MAG: hypothetical protein DRJ40_09565 [Thermoprotei archaeon]